MTDLTVWLTYHDDSMIGQYNLKEDEVLRLFRGNDTGGEWIKLFRIIDSTTIMLFSNAILKGVGRHPKTNKIKMNNGGLYIKRNYHEFCVSESWCCYNYV